MNAIIHALTLCALRYAHQHAMARQERIEAEIARLKNERYDARQCTFRTARKLHAHYISRKS